MENNKPIIAVSPVPATNTKKCSCCGKVLPIDEFQKTGRGYRNICNACYRKETGVSDKFEQFQSRELIAELVARGYKGTLTKTIVKTVKL
jgi:hypothetical protein